MATARRDLAARQGNTLRVEFRLKDANRQPVDLTGSVVKVFVKGASGAAPLVRSTADGTLPMIAAKGVLALVLTPTETHALPAGNCARYEIERTIGPDQTTLLEGSILVEPGINTDG